jgi:hypothetical protein
MDCTWFNAEGKCSDVSTGLVKEGCNFGRSWAYMEAVDGLFVLGEYVQSLPFTHSPGL